MLMSLNVNLNKKKSHKKLGIVKQHSFYNPKSEHKTKRIPADNTTDRKTVAICTNCFDKTHSLQQRCTIHMMLRVIV